MTPERAIEIVAREALHRIVENQIGEEWGNFPEIGEHDWQRVAERVEQLAPCVPWDDYLAAYSLLESRAEEVSG